MKPALFCLILVCSPVLRSFSLADDADSDIVRIGLRIGVQKSTVSCESAIRATDANTGETKEWPAGSYDINAIDNRLQVNGKRNGTELRLEPADASAFLQSNATKVRGALILKAASGLVSVINEVGIDGYLKGVLPREVVVSWPAECLKVQAVASRTYLASHLGRHKDLGFDLCADVHCQVYGGVNKENERCSRAVEETKGKILLYEGKPIGAFFHSNCGGSTEEIRRVWGHTNRAYLPRKKCGYGKEDPRYQWKISFKEDALLAALKAKTKVQGERLKSLRIKKRSPSERVETISVQTDAGTYDLMGNEFRLALHPEKIRSTLWTRFSEQEGGYAFEGMGWGHGVGMCQWGAKGQAERGKNYEDILAFYYPHTKLGVWRRPS